MDTDDLSKETYDGIIIEAEKLAHDLTLQFGLLSYGCKDATEFLDKSGELAKEILESDEDDLEVIFGDNVPEKDKLNFSLRKIIRNIKKIRKITFDKRTYE